MSNFILISKDAMCTDYLPTYGNRQWKTPNIDELARKGTVFRRHYTAAPSTVMSFYSIATGKYSHESSFDVYEKSYQLYEGETLFSKARDLGYQCHIVWAENMMPLKDYLDYFRGDVELHPIDIFRQGVGAHYIHDGFLQKNEQKAQEAFDQVSELIKSIIDGADNIFLWIHFPHVIKGEVSYGSDMELFDRYVGLFRSIFGDDSIAITADHGNMNGHRGKLCYGFDVYEPNIRVPLITPRIGDLSEVSTATSSVDLFEILFKKSVRERTYIYSDSAYRAQPHRKLAVIKGKYKYIYNKKDQTEELYDLEYEPAEELSLMENYIYDVDRRINVPTRELYYYPEWDQLDEIRQELRQVKNRLWKNGSLSVRIKCGVKDALLPIIRSVKKKKIS